MMCFFTRSRNKFIFKKVFIMKIKALSSKDFLDGSRKAFEYNKKLLEENLNPLKSLLSKSIFNDFKSQIDRELKISKP